MRAGCPRSKRYLPEEGGDAVEDAAGDVVLWHRRQLLYAALPVQERDGVVVRAEAALRGRDVVGRDQVQPLGDEL